MDTKTCLLITDDPDDHVAFSEAFRELSDNMVVVIVLDCEKATLLLRSHKLVPDYVFLDLSSYGVQVNGLLKTMIRDKAFGLIPTVVYGDLEDFPKVESPERVNFFDKQFQYSELKEFLNHIG